MDKRQKTLFITWAILLLVILPLFSLLFALLIGP
jgi:hypothetical protein